MTVGGTALGRTSKPFGDAHIEEPLPSRSFFAAAYSGECRNSPAAWREGKRAITMLRSSGSPSPTSSRAAGTSARYSPPYLR